MFKAFLYENFSRTYHRGNSTNTRIEFIDLAKGICILLVVLMHCGFFEGTPMLEQLRMPLFFVLSGFFFKDYGGFVKLIIKKTNGLLIPLLFFMSVETFILLLMSPSTLIRSLYAPFIEPTMINFPLWFLICLFWVNAFYYVIHIQIKNIYIKVSTVCILGLIGYTLSCYDVYLPLFMSTAFTATPYFFVGVILRKLPILYQAGHVKSLLGFGIALLVATVTYCILNGNPRISFVNNFYTGNVIEIFVVSISFVIGTLFICKAVKWLPIISYIGEYSLIVLGLHIIIRNYAYLPLYVITHHTFNHAELLALTLFLCWLAIPVVRRYFPRFSGQSDLIKINAK